MTAAAMDPIERLKICDCELAVLFGLPYLCVRRWEQQEMGSHK